MNLKKMVRAIFLIFSIMLLLGCGQDPDMGDQANVIRQMKWLYTANPEHDFQSALAKKDYRFIGLYGYSLYVPGVEASCISSNKDIKPIEGTSDVVLGYEHAKLIAIANEYAKYFNLKMLLYRDKHMESKCLITYHSSGTAQKREAP